MDCLLYMEGPIRVWRWYDAQVHGQKRTKTKNIMMIPEDWRRFVLGGWVVCWACYIFSVFC